MHVKKTSTGVIIELLDQSVIVDLKCDWSIGIGGSIWTSGLALVDYLERYRTQHLELFQDATIVELGSGTGLVGLAVSEIFQPKTTYLTDMASYLPGLKQNAERSRSKKIQVSELNWETPQAFKSSSPIDIILGTDVAYLVELYEPLVSTLNHLIGSTTVAILGINRIDTNLDFFRMLESAGLIYYKIPDAELALEYRGKDFGLFLISRRKMIK